MPPRAPIILAPSPSPPPQPTNDTQDILIIQDIMDTLDQIPNELTRVHSDLNELGAVLYSTLLNLENKLHTLIDWIQDTSIGPEKRFQLLQEIAEEAARYKLGGDDKIRVAGGACDGIMAHQRHISNLLAASTLLIPTPLSPYSQSLTLAHAPPQSNTRRGVLARAANSPFIMGVASGSGEGRVGDTPSKKKKSRVQQLNVGQRDDDEVNIAGKGGKGVLKKKRVHRAVSPTDSLGSNSAFMGKPSQPQTARQLAAAANRAKKVERADDSDEDSGEDGGRDALGLDMGKGSREGSHIGGRGTPTISSGVGGNGNARSARARTGTKRHRADDDDEDESDGEEDERPAIKRSGTSGNGQKKAAHAFVEPLIGDDLGGFEAEADEPIYCICRAPGYGEMIGCDDETCDYEWFHLGCIGLDKLPGGDWICPSCIERRKKNPKAKKAGKPKVKK